MLYRLDALPAVWNDAAIRAESTRVFDNSHRGRDANLVGALGECVFEHWMRGHDIPFEFVGATTHDYIVGTRGLTLEVKTKDRTVVPRPHYEATIPAYNADHQQPDWYVFVRLLRAAGATTGVRRFTAAFIVGAYPGPEFHAEARLWRAGEVDPANGTKFWTDCYNLPIQRLTDIADAARNWNWQT